MFMPQDDDPYRLHSMTQMQAPPPGAAYTGEAPVAIQQPAPMAPSGPSVMDRIMAGGHPGGAAGAAVQTIASPGQGMAGDALKKGLISSIMGALL